MWKRGRERRKFLIISKGPREQKIVDVMKGCLKSSDKAFGELLFQTVSLNPKSKVWKSYHSCVNQANAPVINVQLWNCKSFTTCHRVNAPIVVANRWDSLANFTLLIIMYNVRLYCNWIHWETTIVDSICQLALFWQYSFNKFPLPVRPSRGPGEANLDVSLYRAEII